MLNLHQLLLAILPPIFYLFLFSLIFRVNDKKQQLKIIEAFILGLFLILPIAYLEGKMTMTLSNSLLETIANNIFVVGFLEEMLKYFILYYLISSQKYLFSKQTFFSFLMISLSASLGFATMENILYVHSGGVEVAIMRIFSAIPLHFSTALIISCFLFLQETSYKKYFGLIGYSIAVLMHGLYNIYTVLYENTDNVIGSYIIPGGYVICSFYLIWFILKQIKRFNEFNVINVPKEDEYEK